MKRTRIIPFLIVISMMLSFVANVSATENRDYKPMQEAEESFVSYLNAHPATAKIIIDGKQFDCGAGDIVAVQVRAGGEYEATFRFDASLRGWTLQHSDYDGGGASYVTLTINYNKSTHNSAEIYLLTAVSGTWAIQDPLVSITDVEVNYGCIGAGPNGGSNSQYSHDNHPPVYLGGFSYTTNFSNYIYDFNGTIGANMTLSYLMGTSRTWTFQIDCNVVNTGFRGAY